MATTGTHDDPRSKRSFQALVTAVTGLVDRAPVSDISITAIVRHAGVTRPTFYKHFQDVPSAVRSAALLRLGRAFPEATPIDPAPCRSVAEMDARLERQARPVLDHLDRHRNFYLRVMDGAASVDLFDVVIGFIDAKILQGAVRSLAQDHGPEDAGIAPLVAGGLMWLAIRWLRSPSDRQNDPAATAKRLAAMTAKLLWSEGRNGQGSRR